MNRANIRLSSINKEGRSLTDQFELEETHEEKSERFNINAFTIPSLITELLLSLVDLLSDFWSGFSLFKLKNVAWGIGSFAINWIPGVIGVIQIVANRRCNGILWTVLYCTASLLLCPLIPTLTFAYLLCKVPRNSSEEKSKEEARRYQNLLSFATLVRALEGCIESPLQLIYKLFLMFNDVIEFNFTSNTFAVQDMHGNNIPMPFFINFLISSMTLLKSVYTLNMPFYKTESFSKAFSKLAWLDFTGFLVSTTLFKLGSLILLLGYFNMYAILPMIAIIFLGICANFATIRDYTNIPNWFLVFMNLFVPICFSIKSTEDITEVQKRT